MVEPLRIATPDLRWADRESWHLTLAFLGEVGEHVLPDLSTRLQRAALASSKPAAGNRRWRGIPVGYACAGDMGRDQGRAPALAALAASVAAGARRAGAPPPDEGRKYRPHLTLARCRQPLDAAHLTRALAAFTGNDWTAASISLISSHLGSGQPRHEELARWPLKPARLAGPAGQPRARAAGGRTGRRPCRGRSQARPLPSSSDSKDAPLRCQ